MISLKAESFTENEIIDPFKVIRYLENTVPRRQVSTELIVAILKKLGRRIKGIRISYRKVHNLKNCIAINGYYDHSKKRGNIEVEVCCNSFKKPFNLDKKLHRALIYDIADTLCHESIHRYQYRSRDEIEFHEQDGDEEHRYYGDPDEMFAFAANISHSLYRQYGSQAVEELKVMRNILKFDPYFSDYYSLFYPQPKFKKIVRMVYLNILAIEQGKILHRPPK